jgi:hypothetical protein
VTRNHRSPSLPTRVLPWLSRHSTTEFHPRHRLFIFFCLPEVNNYFICIFIWLIFFEPLILPNPAKGKKNTTRYILMEKPKIILHFPLPFIFWDLLTYSSLGTLGAVFFFSRIPVNCMIIPSWFWFSPIFRLHIFLDGGISLTLYFSSSV